LIRILDCTLRDGGYINNWNFEDRVSKNIVDALQKSEIDIFECGYLSEKGNNENSTLFKTIDDIDRIVSKEQKSKALLMINFGDYSVDQLPSSSEIFGIRLAFHKKDLKEALELSQEIIQKGFRLFVQPMLTSTYSEEELFHLIKETNKIEPYAFYIVDSFGSMDKNELLKLLKFTELFLKEEIVIGFHSHNNMQMAFSNSIEFLSNTNRDIILDSSIFGMGRGAGNLNSEIICDFLNKNRGTNYKLEPLLDVIDNYLEAIHQENFWGFSVAHFLSGKSRIHPNYATYLLNKKTLSVSQIDTVLNQIEENKKNSFDSNYIEQLYISSFKSDSSEIEFPKEKKILLIASGKNVSLEIEKIKDFIKREDPIVIGVNHINKMVETPYIFFSNQKRFDEFKADLGTRKTILTSNLKSESWKKVDFKTLYNFKNINFDNASILLLNLLTKNGIGKIHIAGLDGYDLNKINNYSYREYTSVLNRDAISQVNENIEKAIRKLSETVEIEFLTESRFKNHKKLRILGVIPARYKSSRFEGKPLCIISGIPMIERTYNQAIQSKHLDKLVVATDDSRIEDFCKSKNIPVVLTSDSCLTGTDRIAEVSNSEHYDLYVNIQGDEPVVDPFNIDLVVEEFKKHGDKYIAYNLYKNIESVDEVASPTIIKTIVNEKDELVYMSRAKVPFNKGKEDVNFNKQVCVYGFTKKALDTFAERTKTLNEKFEDIEILRFIDMGYSVKMAKTEFDSIAVDIPEDVQKVEKFLANQK
jgi:3-deoxy-D-manno-octulosonate cytidylyltransferase